MNFQKFTTFKTILFALVLVISTNQLFAQTTNGIFFQAVARDNFSNPAKDRKIYVQSSIIQTTTTGTKVLTEEHQTNTDATGVFSISLGNGLRVGGTASGLATIDWSKGPFYLNLKIAITPIGGNSSWDYTKEWVDMGTTSFGAVPFALYSANAGGVNQKLNLTDTTKMLSV
jgi:lysozyme family protein